MAEHPMETTVRTALWQQFGAAIDMLENALVACPASLWKERLWSDQEQPDYPTFWYLTYHTLFWLDLYLTGKAEGFAPPAHFRNPFDLNSEFPKQPYTRDELHTYLKHLRQKCQSTITELSDEQGHRCCHRMWWINQSAPQDAFRAVISFLQLSREAGTSSSLPPSALSFTEPPLLRRGTLTRFKGSQLAERGIGGRGEQRTSLAVHRRWVLPAAIAGVCWR